MGGTGELPERRFGWRTLALFAITVVSCRSPSTISEGEQRAVFIEGGDAFRAPDIVVEQFGTLCFWNGTEDLGDALSVTLDRALGGSRPCRTVTGFREVEGKRLVCDGLRPSNCAIICFHELGTFSYHLTRAGRTENGTIRVVAKGLR
ncbi:MAG: hypothetical protein KDC38_00680 [Planctomycetes bacterium]|nr:hypothetical protein [Planctomycetota bacterium]